MDLMDVRLAFGGTDCKQIPALRRNPRGIDRTDANAFVNSGKLSLTNKICHLSMQRAATVRERRNLVAP